MTKILGYDFYGMTMVSLGNREYAVGTNDEADTAVEKYIHDSVWSFESNFIASHAIIDDIDVIKVIQSKYEDANPMLHKLIPDFKKFVHDAVSADSRGHFLSSYNGEEYTLDEIDSDDTREIARILKIKKKDWSNYYVYRLN